MYSDRLVPPRVRPIPRRVAVPLDTLWTRGALLVTLALAAILNFAGLNQEGYANTYYAAAVKSMAMNLHNFWFAAFDPNGFVAVDKPPLGLWFQVASVKLFGFNGVSLLLPQALAGVLSVLVLYRIVAARFGAGAGLLAALALALTPIAVVDNHNNTSDSVLVLFLLLAVWAGLRAAETGRLRFLLGSAVLLGLAFNIKEMEAWLPSAGPSTGFGPGGMGPGGRGFGGPPVLGGQGFAARAGSLPVSKSGIGLQGSASRSAGGQAKGSFGPAGGPGALGGPGGGALTYAGKDVPTINAGLARYLEAHRGHARYLVATPTTGYASLFMLQTGQAAMALGGYQGWDRILSLPALKRLIAAGTIRYFLLDSSGNFGGFAGGPGGNGLPTGDTRLNAVNDDLTTWITSSCQSIPSTAYEKTVSRMSSVNGLAGGPGGGTIGTLYDCASAVR